MVESDCCQGINTENKPAKKILIVDDEELYRWNLCDFIEDEGFIPLGVETGEKGLEALSNQSFDLAIVDMRLPGMNGNTFIEKAQKIDPNLKFIVHTGSTEYSLPLELKKFHLTEEQVLYKPLKTIELLIDKINYLLECSFS